MSQTAFKIVIVGHVDHGKSTLIGRLLHDTGSLPDGKRAELEAVCRRRGTAALEWSYVLDAFQAERDQAVTIDTTQIRFATTARPYVIIDAPGHREFLRNMISGAASADAAILVVDAEEGLQEQTRRHAYLLQLLGLRQLVVVINKMDRAGFEERRFSKIAAEVTACLRDIGLVPARIIPLCARDGDMIAGRGDRLPWYKGDTLLAALDGFQAPAGLAARPLRLPVQDVYRRDERTRIIVGRVESGIVRRGDVLIFSPANEKAVVTALETWPPQDGRHEARAGEVIGLTLDQKIFVERGYIASHEEGAPFLSGVFRTRIFWLSEKPLCVGDSYRIRIATQEATVTVQSIDRIIDTQALAQDNGAAVQKNMAALITLRARDPLPLDPHEDNPATGRLVIYDGYDVVGGGTISLEGYADQRRAPLTPRSQNIHTASHLIRREDRAQQQGHEGAVFWLTGLSAAGKTTLAMAVEKALFDRGRRVYVLDGDNIRAGLNADLGFSPEDRTENIRRVGEVAGLMSDAGLIVITSFISPYRADRDRARMAAPQCFHEIYIRADLVTCETRDPKGLYKKARAGKISSFTGIDSPYEAPDNPDLIVDTQSHGIDLCVEQILRYIETVIALSDRKKENHAD